MSAQLGGSELFHFICSVRVFNSNLGCLHLSLLFGDQRLPGRILGRQPCLLHGCGWEFTECRPAIILVVQGGLPVTCDSRERVGRDCARLSCTSGQADFCIRRLELTLFIAHPHSSGTFFWCGHNQMTQVLLLKPGHPGVFGIRVHMKGKRFGFM